MEDSGEKLAKELFYSGSCVPVHLAIDNADTEVKKRNRLAQRKHRQMKRLASTELVPPSHKHSISTTAKILEKDQEDWNVGDSEDQDMAMDKSSLAVSTTGSPRTIEFSEAEAIDLSSCALAWTELDFQNIFEAGTFAGVEQDFTPQDFSWNPNNITQVPPLSCLPNPKSQNTQSTSLAPSDLQMKDSRVANTREKSPADQSLHDRFEAILETVDVAGFCSFDEMATEYYTAKLDKDSPFRSTQTLSRVRHLKGFLHALNDSTRTWSDHELWGYKEEILQIARTILSDEVSQAFEIRDPSYPDQSNNASSLLVSPISRTSSEEFDQHVFQALYGFNDLLLHGNTLDKVINQETRRFREGVPETWALFAMLASKANVPNALSSRIICIIMCLLFKYQKQYS
ncbi:hypothetical protein G7Y89_g9254 [Cudoniella acicularis]|uniref:BZIP domain-containing protein n=1 Tax=Cudoniella acicularis TaxID=354080 RepID=A0A8H4W098_9HELO|nr:hypothetical protein G7Y89_g9254 [Cudoniella acicularis]